MHTHHSHDSLKVTPPKTTGRFIRWAGYYDRFVDLMTFGKARALRQASIALAELVPGEYVLEIGCGTGDLALAAIAQVGTSGRVVGIDASPEMIAVAQAKANTSAIAAEFFVQPVEHMAFADHSFDVVLSSLMMHHLPDTLKQQALMEVRRVLKPGGRLIIVDIRRPTSLAGRMLNIMLLHGAMKAGVQDLGHMLTQAGFQIQEIGTLPIRMLGFIRASIVKEAGGI